MSAIVLLTPKIRLRCQALKRVNKGGGLKQGRIDKKHDYTLPVEGSDYVIFICPGCNQRNKKNINQAKEVRKEDLALVLSCNHCARHIEVTPPFEVGVSQLITR